jgi:hypothetical protein
MFQNEPAPDDFAKMSVPKMSVPVNVPMMNLPMMNFNESIRNTKYAMGVLEGED